MSTITNKAQLIAKDIQSGGLAVTEPVQEQQALPISGGLITQIIAIISDIMHAFSQCGQSPAQVAQTLRNPGPIAKMSLRRSIRRNVPNAALFDPILHSTLKTAVTTTEEDVKSMLSELQYAY